MDADKKMDIDICDAVFGTEFVSFSGDHPCWSREKGGFFYDDTFINKVAGVITIRRKEWKPVANHYVMLFLNNKFRDRLEELDKLLSYDKVIHYNMRPPVGNGNFKFKQN